MRFVVARRSGLRGEGLGNEVISWAKGWLASEALDARLVGPSFGLNRRRYYRNFKTSRLDFVFEEMLLRLPHYRFTESDYRNSGAVDFGLAVKHWAAKQGLANRRSFVVEVDGMWGGYPSIRNARPFLLAKLLNSRDALSNVQEVMSNLDRNKLFVAVHMRTAANEFTSVSPGQSERGKFNILIPGDWYLWVCEALEKEFPGLLQFRFFTDKGGPAFDEAIRRFNPGQTRQNGLTECSDLLLMAFADLRVCSISSYSLVASFLANGPYVWYEPQLTLMEGAYSLWGHEKAQAAEDSLTGQATRYIQEIEAHEETIRNSDGCCSVRFLGSPIKPGDPLPSNLVALLRQRLSRNDWRTNLLEYGCFPEALSHQ